MTYKSGQKERISKILDLHEQAFPGMPVTEDSLINGAVIRNICEYEAGGYKRVTAWLKGQILSNKEAAQEEMEQTKNTKTDAEKMEDFFAKCLELYKEREGKYGRSWHTLSAHTTANLIEMKANRAKEMGEENAKSLDEAFDMANYAGMLYIILNHEK